MLASCATPSTFGPVSALPGSGVAAQSASRTAVVGASAPVCGQTALSLSQLEGCIVETSLWSHLSQLQTIAEAHRGTLGHPSRDTGTPGYRASVDYVRGLMQQAGYTVSVQQYNYLATSVSSAELASPSKQYALERDYFVARRSGAGTLTAPVDAAADGCAASDFGSFTRGHIALIERGTCAFETEVDNAQAAGASAVVVYARPGDAAYEAKITDPASIPVIGVASNALGEELLAQVRSGGAPSLHIDVKTHTQTGIDYNLIADSPYGNTAHTFVVEGHLDAIYGEGILDNGSGSITILDIALALAKTPTTNHLRFIWFGGEELGLLGSHYYTKHLTQPQRSQISFDLDADVTATPNYDILIADPAFAPNVSHFPPNVVPHSYVGTQDFANYFKSIGVASQSANFGNAGTDSNSFSLIGIPNTGILTNQDCCKKQWEVNIWGGFRGNYEGTIPSFNGGCVDQPHRWCDNLDNNDPFIFELVSKAVAAVTYELANDPSLGS